MFGSLKSAEHKGDKIKKAWVGTRHRSRPAPSSTSYTSNGISFFRSHFKFKIGPPNERTTLGSFTETRRRPSNIQWHSPLVLDENKENSVWRHIGRNCLRPVLTPHTLKTSRKGSFRTTVNTLQCQKEMLFLVVHEIRPWHSHFTLLSCQGENRKVRHLTHVFFLACWANETVTAQKSAPFSTDQ